MIGRLTVLAACLERIILKMINNGSLFKCLCRMETLEKTTRAVTCDQETLAAALDHRPGGALVSARIAKIEKSQVLAVEGRDEELSAEGVFFVYQDPVVK